MSNRFPDHTYVDFKGDRMFWVNFNEGGRGLVFAWKGRSGYISLPWFGSRLRFCGGPLFGGAWHRSF